MSFYTHAELSADLGRCLRDAGEHEQATRLISEALETYEPWRVRSRCFVQADLAATHVASGDHERAVSLGEDAVATAAQVNSSRTLDRLRTLQRQFRRSGAGSPVFDDLDFRITKLLAGSLETL
ncbi:MAG: tetratricopeptide repeat protein [Pseudonocardia sp.]